jgi:Ca-activated chloride channel family protein
LRRSISTDLADRLLVLTDGFTLDEDDCRRWAAYARQAHIPISTMGLGGDFNEELMIPIADQTGGEAYLLGDPEEIPVALAQELQRAQAVRYRNLELKLRPSQGVEIRTAFRVQPSIAPLEPINEGGSYSFPLGDLVEGEEPAVLLELVVPPRPAGLYRLFQVVLASDDPAGGRGGLKTRADVVVEYTADAARAAQYVAQVMHVVEALSAYKLQRRAQADLAAGDVTAATRKLRVAATRLLDMGEEELAAEAERQALALEQHGQADPRLTKKLRYETRKLTRRLAE